MGRTIIAASGLVALWLLMSGIYDKSLILIFGAISVALAVWVGKRMDAADGEQLPFPVNPIAVFKYLMWLLVEIAKSNWAVTMVILSGKKSGSSKDILGTCDPEKRCGSGGICKFHHTDTGNHNR